MVDSITRTPISRADAERIVESAFGGRTSLRSITACDEGWFNAVHLLELGDGTECVELPLPPAGFADLVAEIRAG